MVTAKGLGMWREEGKEREEAGVDMKEQMRDHGHNGTDCGGGYPNLYMWWNFIVLKFIYSLLIQTTPMSTSKKINNWEDLRESGGL